jgi:glycosyltransferase involved in cell wall biosynthesis
MTRDVWMLTGDFYPGMGGGERQVQLLSRELIKKAWTVNVITRRHGFEHLAGVAPHEIVDTIPVHRLYTKGGSKVASLLYLLGGLGFLLRHGRRAIYHAHGEGVQAWVAVIARYLLSGRAVIKLRSGQQAYAKRYISGLRRQQFLAQLRLADRIIVVNSEVEAHLHTLGISRQKIVLMPNGVDTTQFAPIPKEAKTSVRQALGLPEDKHIVLYIGRLDKIKGVDLLLRAWARLPAPLLQKILLVIVGRGPELDALQSQVEALAVQDTVLMTGLKHNVLDYYHAADIFALPSRSEGLSNALGEAMACGLPAVASALGGALDLIREGESGSLFEPENTEQLCEKLAQLLSMDAQRLQIGVSARQAVIAYNDLYAMLSRLETLYCSLG